MWSGNKSARHYGSSNKKVLKYCPFAKKYFTSEQLLGEHFHLELCKQHKTVLSHFMRQNLHGNRGHLLDWTIIGRTSLRVVPRVEDDPRVGNDPGFCDFFLPLGCNCLQHKWVSGRGGAGRVLWEFLHLWLFFQHFALALRSCLNVCIVECRSWWQASWWC